MKERIRNLELVVSAVLALSSCSKSYTPNITTTASPLSTDVFKPDSASIAQNYKIPDWFRNSKFGIFIHWGVYTVPAYGSEWYARSMYAKGSDVYKYHVNKYGPVDKFGYKNFIPMFKAEHFNADNWAKVFKESGAKYVVPVAEHHDGFAMYHSTFNKWNACDMGPKRDVVGELEKAVRKQNLYFGVSSHRCENAWFYEFGMDVPSDVQDTTITLYGERLHSGDLGLSTKTGKYECSNARSRNQFLKQTYEIIDQYKPDIFWFDWMVGKSPFQPTFYKFMAYYYNNAIDWNKQVVVNTKFGYGDNIQVLDIERGKSDRIRKYPWQTDTSIGKKSWSYCVGEVNKTPDHIIDDFVDIVSKNGNLLLNIGPKEDGTITNEQKNVLLEMGKWLKVNGEAIYSSRPWVVATQGNKGTAGYMTDNTKTNYAASDLRFTVNGNNLYVIALAWTEGKILVAPLSKNYTKNLQIESVSMLGSKENIDYKLTDKGLEIQFPKQEPTKYAHAFKVQLKGVIIAKPLIDIMDNGIMVTVRMANHSAEEVTINLKSVVNVGKGVAKENGIVSADVVLAPKSVICKEFKIIGADKDNLNYKFYINSKLTYEKK